jgi:hypothetical protein
MKRIRFSIVLTLFLILFSPDIYAQKNTNVSISYSYLRALDLSYGFIRYPFGLGASLSLPVCRRLTFYTGMNYSFRHHIYKDSKTYDKFTESLYLLNIGLYYSIINKKLLVQIGGKLGPMYNHENWKLHRYNSPYEIDIDQSDDVLSLGFDISIKVEHSIFKRFSMFIEPAQTFYLSGQSYFFGDNRKLCSGIKGAIGITYFLK